MEESLTLTRKDVRQVLNNLPIGRQINLETFEGARNRGQINSYFAHLHDLGFLNRIARGEYTISKKITLKKRGARKGKRYNRRLKDVSMIPYILRSNPNGLVIKQIHAGYDRVTPADKRVNKGYLYRLLKFASDNGVIKIVGKDERYRKRHTGRVPNILSLVNDEITDQEWAKVVEDFRTFYQYKKESKTKRLSAPKTIAEKYSCCDSIIEDFDENRDNPNKQYVENFFIQKVKERLGDKKVRCFVITGPDYHHHMDSLFRNICDHAFVCEIAPDVFESVWKKAQCCPYKVLENKVSLMNCDANDITPVNCLYSDMDLMRTLKSNYEIVSGQIKRQDANCSKEDEKYITFTFTQRRQGGDIFGPTLHYLKKLVSECFGSDLESISQGIDIGEKQAGFKHCKQHFPLIRNHGRINKMHLFTYQDRTPMVSVLIAYK